MKGETLANLIQCGVTLLLGIIALAGALFCNASFHFFTAMACFWLAWVFYSFGIHQCPRCQKCRG